MPWQVANKLEKYLLNIAPFVGCCFGDISVSKALHRFIERLYINPYAGIKMHSANLSEQVMQLAVNYDIMFSKLTIFRSWQQPNIAGAKCVVCQCGVITKKGNYWLYGRLYM